MAENGMRQLGPPRIGDFAERIRPDPLHCEINAWQNLLDLIYEQAVQHSVFDKFIKVLSAPTKTVQRRLENNNSHLPADPITTSPVASGPQTQLNLSPSSLNFSNLSIEELAQQRYLRAVEKSANFLPSTAPSLGCGLAPLAARISEHYNENKRHNKLPVRLIGDQAITLAQYGFRLIDCLKTDDESAAEKLKRQALTKIAEYLRNAGGLFNKIFTNDTEIVQLQEYCELYFCLYALFFPSHVNVSVWTMGYAIPYHAQKLYQTFKIGYGITSLQAKESKHSGLKEELRVTNRSKECSKLGKWWQVMRINYVKTFYLPEHQPLPPTYTPLLNPELLPTARMTTSVTAAERKKRKMTCFALYVLILQL